MAPPVLSSFGRLPGCMGRGPAEVEREARSDIAVEKAQLTSRSALRYVM